MRRESDPRAIQFFGCFLCEGADRPPVAVCRRCGAFVCRRHAVRLIHPPLRKPVGGLMAPPNPAEKRRRLEMICEVCYLEDLAARGEAV